MNEIKSPGFDINQLKNCIDAFIHFNEHSYDEKLRYIADILKHNTLPVVRRFWLEELNPEDEKDIIIFQIQELHKKREAAAAETTRIDEEIAKLRELVNREVRS